ncbi:hypothetical protein pipiens_005944 [Culex pipiens pipiens]|uniref:Peptidase S1 domain-containing protein n=1 Tax=Culex pipiens pipiens TaxID=38569 RepID=A0ABD1DSJ1_CULPP
MGRFLLSFAAFYLTIPVLAGHADSNQCGNRKVLTQNAIQKGQSTYSGAWPWHCAVFHLKNRALEYACGGTLIHRKFVLTADHCVLGDNGYVLTGGRIRVRLGVHRLYLLNTQTWQEHCVHAVHRYGQTVPKRKNDIAMLELGTEAEFTDYVQPVCVDQRKLLAGEIGTVVGWGYTEYDELADTLQSARIPVIGTIECLESDRDVFGQVLDSSLFCAGFTNGTTVCNGDSGGGLYFERENVCEVNEDYV